MQQNNYDVYTFYCFLWMRIITLFVFRSEADTYSLWTSAVKRTWLSYFYIMFRKGIKVGHKKDGEVSPVVCHCLVVYLSAIERSPGVYALSSQQTVCSKEQDHSN